jgi:CheY-like chemotaxis protein
MEQTPVSTILIVEDDPNVIELVELCLRGEGYFFRRAADGQKGLNAARREKPDLVIMDLMMPGMDGYTAASMLASDDQTRDVPVIILTAKREMRDAFSMSPNIVDFIEKPFDPSVLRARVQKALASRAR